MKLTENQKDILERSQADGDVFAARGDTADINTLAGLSLVKLVERRNHIIDQPHARLCGRGLWPVWAIEHFPTAGNMEEVAAWKPVIQAYALHRQVLVVMKTRVEGTWKAYCGPVPGQDHENERYEVLRQGEAVSEKLAREMFCGMDGIPYAT